VRVAVAWASLALVMKIKYARCRASGRSPIRCSASDPKGHVTSRIVGASRSGRDAPRGGPRKEVWMTDPTLTTLLLLLLVVLAIQR